MKTLSIPKKVNGTIVRLVAAQVFFLSLSYILTGLVLFPAVLVADFCIRALGYPNLSPLALIGRLLTDWLKMEKRLIFFKPKRFAATIGLVLSFSALILFSFNLKSASFAVMVLLGFFSFLEAFWGYCAGCKIYGFLISHGWLSEKNCPDCAY